MRTLRSVLKDADPNLNIAPRRGRRKMTHQDWEAAEGKQCPRCGNPALRFRIEDGVCRECANGLNEKVSRDEKKKAQFEKHRKAWNARVDRNRKRGASSSPLPLFAVISRGYLPLILQALEAPIQSPRWPLLSSRPMQRARAFGFGHQRPNGVILLFMA